MVHLGISRNRKNVLARRILAVPTYALGFLACLIGVLLYWYSREIMGTASVADLLFSSSWHPMAGDFGFLPFIMGTVWVTFLSMALAVPISLLSAVYLSEYMHPRVRQYVRPFIDLLAGIPSVVYGLFGVLLIVPIIRDILAPLLGVPSSGYCVLAGALILCIMVFPILISISYEVLRIVPQNTREAALAMGATRWETVKYVVVRSAFPGLIAAIILGFSRAFGETMAVLMVVGNVARVPSSIFDPAYPIPALIANNYGEMMSIPLYESALMFAALILFFVVVLFVLLAKLMLVRIRRRFA